MFLVIFSDGLSIIDTISRTHEALNQCRVTVDPSSTTLSQQWPTIRPMPRVCWVINSLRVCVHLTFRTQHKVDIFDINHGDQRFFPFENIIIFLVSSFHLIWISMLWVSELSLWLAVDPFVRVRYTPSNTRYWANDALKLAQRPVRWANVKLTLWQYIVFAGVHLVFIF